MQYSDMHVHTASSPDADLSASRLCGLARSREVSRIGFVAHLDLHPSDFCFNGFDENLYEEELDLAEGENGPEVLRGIEIGEPHRYMDSALKMFHPGRYDFITGALHWLDESMILSERAFQGHDPLRIIHRYYSETLDILERGGIHIIAHMGIFRRGMARAGLSVDLDETALFPDLLQRVLELVIDTEVALEVNTAGLRRPEGTTYPTPSVLRLYRELGGRLVTLGSDTHRKENAFFGLNRGAALINACGFHEYGFFKRGNYVPCPLQPL